MFIALKKTFLLLMVLWAYALPAKADQGHRRNLLPGGRAAAMGGAYTALSDDPEGTYYNPAGLAFAKDNELSVTANGQIESKTTYKSAVNGRDFNETSRTVFPNFIGGSYRLGPLTFGYAYLTLDARNIDQTDQFKDISTNSGEANSYNRTHQEANSLINAGGAISLKITESISLGLSTFYYLREIIASNHQMTRINGGASFVLDYKYTTKNEGYIPVVGLLSRGKNLSMGISVRVPTAISDRTKLYTDGMSYIPSASDSTPAPQILSEEVDWQTQDEVNPMTIQAGGAAHLGDNFVIASDLLYYPPKEHPQKDLGGQSLVETFNYSLGLEARIDFALFRLGGFTNNSFYPKVKEGKNNQYTHIDYQGVSMALGINKKDMQGTAGAVFQEGSGKAQVVTNSATIQEVKGASRTLFICGSYTL